MTVARVVEPPRVTKPYTDEQWRAIDLLGDKVDAVLNEGDVRLTMGGEPTFVSIDDMDGAEWTTAAVGPTKRIFGDTLIRRLRERFAPGGLLHYGQGKWYPGESLPRWAFSLYWRGDGKPLWKLGPAKASRAPVANWMAERVLLGLAQRLGVDPQNIQPAFKDPFHYLHAERQLPYNVTPLDNRLGDAEERARMSEVFERGLDQPKGYVLPVQRWQGRAWISEKWVTRQGRLFLIPGDSPVGLRLPLRALAGGAG